MKQRTIDQICEKKCLFSSFFNESNENMFITSREGFFINMNTSMEKLLGYNHKELINKPVSITYDSEADRIVFQNEIEEKGVVHDFQITLKKKDGTTLFCLIDAIAWKEGNEIVAYHGIVRTNKDIVENFQNYFNRLKKERAELKKEKKNLYTESMLMMRYMDDDTVNFIQKTGSNPLEAASKKVTILFFDIRNSTGIAECVSPAQFADFLCELFTDIMDLIYGSGGSVNKMLGDGLMATFGCPMSSGNDSYNAVETALQIQKYLETYNDVRPDYIEKEVTGGIGIATGIVFAGITGSVRRQEYAVLGDSVNIASRLESLTKKTDGNILVDHNTYKEVKEQFNFKKKISGNIQGKKDAIIMHSL